MVTHLFCRLLIDLANNDDHLQKQLSNNDKAYTKAGTRWLVMAAFSPILLQAHFLGNEVKVKNPANKT